MELILRLTPKDPAMVQLWLPTASTDEYLAGVMHEDNFPLDLMRELQSDNCDQITVSIIKKGE